MSHLDEGTLHAWLDGALPPDESARVEAHVAECATCAAAAAEARGVIAASSRILSALDDVPGGVIPDGGHDAGVRSLAELRAARSRQRTVRWARRFAPIAAVVAFVAVGIVVARTPSVTLDSRESAQSVTLRATSPEAAPAPAAADTALLAPGQPAPPRAVRAPESEVGTVGVAASTPRRDAAREQVAPTAPSDELRKRSAEADLAANRVADSGRANEPAAGAPRPPVATPPAAVAQLRGQVSSAQAGADIRGRVTDDKGAPVPSAQVTVLGTTAGTTTAADGSFELKDVPTGTRTLSARRVGYESAERKVEAQAGQNADVELKLTERALALEEQLTTVRDASAIPTRRLAGLTLISTTDTTVNGQPARRSRYRLSSGEEIALLETRSTLARSRQEAAGKASADAPAARRAAPAEARAAPVNTLWWTTPEGTEITLSGPVSVEELERIRRAVGM